MTIGVDGKSPPACSHREGLHPSIRWGNGSTPPLFSPESRVLLPRWAWKVPVLMSSTRQPGDAAAALPGQDFPSGVHAGARVAFREVGARAEEGRQRVRDRMGEPEAGLQSRGPREDREQPEPAVQNGRRQTFQRRLCSFLTHWQVPKFTGLSGGRGEFSFQKNLFQSLSPVRAKFSFSRK